MSYRGPQAFHGQGQQGQQPSMNPNAAFMGGNGPNGTQGGGAGFPQPYGNPQQQFYPVQGQQQQQQQQSYIPQMQQQQQQMAQYGGMATPYQGFDPSSQAYHGGGHPQMLQQAATSSYMPSANVWQHQQSPQAQPQHQMMFQQQQHFQPQQHQQQIFPRHVASPQRQPTPQQIPSPSPRRPSVIRTPSISQQHGFQISLPQSPQMPLPQSPQITQLSQTQHHQQEHRQQSLQHHRPYEQPQQSYQHQLQAQTQHQPHGQRTPVRQQSQTSFNSHHHQNNGQSLQLPQQQPVSQPMREEPTPVSEPEHEHQPEPKPEPEPEPEPEPFPDPVPQSQPPPSLEPVHNFVNLQDIQQIPPSQVSMMGQSQGTPVAPPTPDTINPAQLDSITVQPLDTITVKPMDIMLKTPQPQPSTQHRTGAATPRIKPSPHSSVSNSPALTARSPSITKKSPAITPKSRPVDTVQMMVAVAEECFGKARSAVHDVAMSSDPARIDEYQNLITTGLACLEASLQSNRLSPRQEARMRLRYASMMLEETENLMEAETALTKGITICDKHRLFDLKYCMQYLMLKVLFQRSPKAALNAVDRHIADCEAFKHIHWLYTFKLLKATFHMEVSQTADASVLNNIQSIQTIANARGDNALSVFASILEGLTLLKASKDGTMERVQTCIAQAAKFQFDPSVHIMQLDLMTLLLDLASSINLQSPDLTSQKLRLLQKQIDNCDHALNFKADFVVPIKKQPSTGQTISADTCTIIQEGDHESPSDFLVLSFMTPMELRSLVHVLSGLASLHKLPSGNRSAATADYWREGLKIVGDWDQETKGTRYGASVSLREAIRQREWRVETQIYLNILLGLLAASHCQWGQAKQFIDTLDSLIAPSTQSILKLLSTYLSGVYYQGTGDLPSALAVFQIPGFSLSGRGPGVKAAQKELSLLAALNRLWILQHPSQRDDPQTLELIEQLQPLCSVHPNIDLRTAWHNVMAALVTDPPQQLNMQKQHIQAAMGGSRSTNNVLGAAVTLAIMRSRLFENVIGEQALKSALAAAKQAQRSGNVLWQSVADGMLAQSLEVQGQREEAAREWDKATREAMEAFSGR